MRLNIFPEKKNKEFIPYINKQKLIRLKKYIKPLIKKILAPKINFVYQKAFIQTFHFS